MTKPDCHQDARAARDLLYPQLEALIELIDESAAIAYPRALHRRHLTRLLVFLIGLGDNITSRDLTLTTGYEKAQISRGLKELAEAGLLDRPELRGGIRLNAAGLELFAQIMVIARQRDERLRDGITGPEIQRFLAITTTLIERTSRLIAPDEAENPGTGAESRSMRTSISAPSPGDLILPSLRNLMVHIRRSGNSLFRREVGLSNLEWRVLSLIAQTRPINLSALIPLTGRDKSQVARAIKQLHADGLIERQDEARTNIGLTLTAAGDARQGAVRAIGANHDALVFAGFEAGERAFYMTVVRRLCLNAACLLQSEKAGQSKAADASGSALQKLDTQNMAMELEHFRQENQQLRQRLAEALTELSALRG